MKPPRALTIAGSDSGGGAGIQADLKTFFALGVHGMSALTALTAQNTVGVTGIHEVPPSFVEEQINAVVSDIGVDAVKTGMLSSAPIVTAVADAVRGSEIANLVVDPVFVSKHGVALLQETAVDALRNELVPLALVLTPNIAEAEGLLGYEIDPDDPDEAAAKELVTMGPRWVLLKGGHLRSDEAVDLLTDGTEVIRFTQPRLDTKNTHGTGCVLSAALTACLAKGLSVPEAAAQAKKFVTRAIERSLEIGRGIGPVNPAWGLW
jgi:hydroxymethylpyrimidine kinase/phosphomethylpyrimidine kinase